MSEVAEVAGELVSIPSHENESEAGDFIETWLRVETDADVTRDTVGNVIARRDTTEGATDTLALIGHHDVVPPDDSQTENGEYVVTGRDGRLYGRGAADMKGAVAAAMCAFRDCVPSMNLVFASFVGEELGGEGARPAIENGFSPDYAVVGEGTTGYSAPGSTDVAIAHKGRRASTITAHGEAAHASQPEVGENAIYRACDAVEAIRNLDAPTAEVFGERVAGSLAVTEISGGSAWNVIPESASVTIDERTVSGKRAALERIADAEGIEWSVEQDLPPMACDDEDFAEMVLKAASEAQDGDSELVTKPQATDAGWLADAGITCVICGPCEPGEAHTKTESVSLDVLERCYRIYRNVAESADVG